MTYTVQVPREATSEMMHAGIEPFLTVNTKDTSLNGHVARIYAAMIAAAPQATDPRDADLMRQELNEISAAIGSVRFMDPPDGGDVSLAEQVTRMREALDKAEEWNRLQARDIVTLGHLAGQTLAAQAENEKLRDALGFYATYIVTGERARITLASLSPPPLSPEKP